MRALGSKIGGSPRTWLLWGAVVWATACGTNPDDEVSPTVSPFSEDSCRSASADVGVGALPEFSVTSPGSYNTCTKSYVVWVTYFDQTFTPTPNSYHDAVVSYAGTVPTTKGACEALTGAAYFYVAGGNAIFASSSGAWISQFGTCIPPAMSLRDFNQYIEPLTASIGWGTRLKIASTMRDIGDFTQPMKIASARFTTQAPSGCSSDGAAYMLANQGLFTNQSFSSCDGRFRLYMQGDGNLVLSQKDSHGAFSIALWTSRTNGVSQANVVQMQGDGNLVIYSVDGRPIWATGTAGKPGLHLKIFNDGNMKLYDGAYGTVWQTNTGGH